MKSSILILTGLALALVGCNESRTADASMPATSPPAPVATAPAPTPVAVAPAPVAPPAVKPPAAVAPPVAPAPAAAGTMTVLPLRINCGAAKPFTDPAGLTWLADKDFRGADKGWGGVGGDWAERDQSAVKNAADPTIYLTERYGDITYRIPVANGTYTVKLHFCETFDGITAAGERVFDVKAEGKPLFTDVDPFKDGGDALFSATVRTAEVAVADGELTLDLVSKEQNALINALEVRAK